MREQIAATPALQPQAGLRGSPITAVVLTGAEIDQTAGLLVLRERHAFTIYGSAETLDTVAANPMFNVLGADVVARRACAIEAPFTLADGLIVELFRVPGKVPLYLEGADPDLAVVFQVELRGSTKFMREFSAAGFAEDLDLLRKTFEEGQRSGVFRKDLNAKVVSKILFGALDEMATNWIISKRSYKLEPMADVVMDVFLNGVISE